MKYPARTKMVKGGTVCHPSKIGQHNFYYPDQSNECKFVSDTIIVEKSWVRFDGLRAVSVPSGFVENLCETGNKISIVWINPEAIEVY